MLKVKRIIFSVFFLIVLLLGNKNTIAQSAGIFVHYVKANPWSTFQSFLEAESQGSNSSYVSLKNQNGAYGFFQMEGPTAKGSNYSLDFKHSSFSGPILSLFNNGNIGVGPSFTGSNVPASLLHLRSAFCDVTLESNSASYPAARILFNANGAQKFIVSYQVYPGPGSGRFRLGPNDNTSSKSIYMHSTGLMAGKMLFASNNNSEFGFGQYVTVYPGLSGAFVFDDQVSSPSLLVAPPVTTLPYTTIPSGYLFSVKGNSNLGGRVQIENTTDADPDKSIAGINIGNNLTNTAPAVPYSWIQSQESRPLALNPDPNANPTTTNTSYVAIGFIPGTYTVPLHYKLAVKGRIICEELKVKYAGQWSDYVFEKEYKLRELKEVEKFIAENKHLPDVPSEAEIKSEGIESGQMDATLLRKIEELTLYMIDQNKRIAELELQLKKRKNRK